MCESVRATWKTRISQCMNAKIIASHTLQRSFRRLETQNCHPATDTSWQSRLLMLLSMRSSPPKRLHFIKLKCNFSANGQPLKEHIHPHTLSIAPMMDFTNKHQRTLMRLITKKAVLYTEMVVCNTLLHRANKLRSLEAEFSVENPLVMQLGGSDPAAMRDATRIAMDFGYKEFNINVGCPSDKVSGAGAFGAALMRSPRLVCDLAQASAEALGEAPTIKCRIGVNDMDSYEHLSEFISIVSRAGGVSHFIIHARTAILGGRFSPKQNRTIPPLKYSFAYRLANDFPHLSFSVNGGVLTLEEAESHLQQGGGTGKSLVGVMVGRSAISNPFCWRHVDSRLYGVEDLGYTRGEILSRYAVYAQGIESAEGPKTRHSLIKPLHNLFAGSKNGKRFRCSLSNNVKDSNMGMYDVILKASESIGDVDVLEFY